MGDSKIVNRRLDMDAMKRNIQQHYLSAKSMKDAQFNLLGRVFLADIKAFLRLAPPRDIPRVDEPGEIQSTEKEKVAI